MKAIALRLFPPLAVTVLVFAAASLAWASTKTVNDRRGDSVGGVDIRSVTAITRSHSIVWRIKTYGRFRTSAAPCMAFSPGAQSQPPGNEFQVCGDGKIHNFLHGGLSGRAKLKRPDRKTIVYRVHRSLLSGAGAIEWQARAEGAKCPDICDQVPDGPGRFAVQKL